MFGLLALTFAIYAGIIFVIAKIIKENTGITIGLSIIFATIFLIVIGIALYYEVDYIIGFAILGAIILFAFACLVNYMFKKTKRVFISFVSTCCLIIPVVIFSVFSIYPHSFSKSHSLVSNYPYSYSNQGEEVIIKNDGISFYKSTGYLSYYYYGRDTIKPYEDEKEYSIVASLYYSNEENCINVAAYGKPMFGFASKSEYIETTIIYNYVDEIFIKKETTVYAEELLQEKASAALKERGFDYFNKALSKQGMNVFEAIKRSDSYFHDEEIKAIRDNNLILLGIFLSMFVGGIIVTAAFAKKDKNVVIPKKEKPTLINKTISFYKARFVKKDERTLSYSYTGARYEDITNFSYETDIETASFSNCKIAIILGYRRNLPIGGPEIVNISRLSNVAATYQDRIFVEKNSSGYCNCIETIGLIFDSGIMIPLLANSPISMNKTPEEFLTSLLLMINELSYF